MENTSQMSSPFAFAWTGADVDHLNAPELNSPQPCTHGAGCTYFGSCRFVHPGEEGTSRMQFEARTVTNDDGTTFEQPACVRLIGNPGFYKRCRARMSWPEWCARNSIPYTPNPPRAPAEGTQQPEDAGQEQQPRTPQRGAPRGRGSRGSGRGRGAPARAPRPPRAQPGQVAQPVFSE